MRANSYFIGSRIQEFQERVVAGQGPYRNDLLILVIFVLLGKFVRSWNMAL